MSLADDVWSNAVSMVRFYRGSWVRHGGARRTPERLLELREVESCAHSRKVRETLSELDLEWLSRPAHGQQHPLLIDPNRDTRVAGSEAILEVLHSQYGAGRPHATRLTARFNTLNSRLASAIRPLGRETRYADRKQPDAALELYQFEGCPYCRKVRERLHELNLVFHVRTASKGSPRRETLRAQGGRIQVPYLVDPNRSVSMYESDDINRYLSATYG